MGMNPACSEALFNHLCQAGLLPFPWLARCSAVSKQWKGDLANALPTLRSLDFGDCMERVTGADVLRALARVAGANLRVVDIRGLLIFDTGSTEEIQTFIRSACPSVSDILQDKYVSLTVRQSTGRTTSCTISETCELRELMEWWCRCERGDMDRTRFIFDGIQLVRHDTPQQFGMGDGDVIHVMMSYGGAPKEGCYMENHVVASIPPAGETVPVNTEISVTFRPSFEPSDAYPARREITLAAFHDAAAPCRVDNPLPGSGPHAQIVPEVYDDHMYKGRVPPWTENVLGPKFHVVVMEPADVARVGGSLEYHCVRNNGCYYSGDEHSWQRYTKHMPLAGSLAVDEATRTIRFTPAEPLRPAQTYGIVLQHYAVGHRGCHSDVVIPFATQA